MRAELAVDEVIVDRGSSFSVQSVPGLGCLDSVHKEEMRLSDDLRLYCGMECWENDGEAQTTEKGQSWH